MKVSILVFNRESLGKISEEGLLTAITESNYATLCRQYGLDPSLIEPALSNLGVEGSVSDQAPFFLVKYGMAQNRAVFVQQWGAAAGGGEDLLNEVVEGIALESLKTRLRETRRIIEITLMPVQLKDMGLLLAYEIARWAADRGKGVVYGLDGAWYRLNQHKAFIPMNASKK